MNNLIMRFMLVFVLISGFHQSGKAQENKTLKVTLQACQVNFDAKPSRPGATEIEEKDWFTLLKKREGKLGILADMPVYLKVEVINNTEQTQSLRFPSLFPKENRWLTLELQKDGGRKFSPPQFSSFFDSVDGPAHSSTGGPEQVILKPGESYREYLCLNQSYSLHRSGNYRVTAKIRFLRFDEAKKGQPESVYLRTDGQPFEQITSTSFQVWDFRRQPLETLLAKYTDALAQSKVYSKRRRMLLQGWLSFPAELCYSTWENYISHQPCTEILDTLNRLPTVASANMAAYIAANANCSVEDRHRAMGLLRVMKIKESEVQLNDFSVAVDGALARLEGHVPSLFDTLR